MTTLYLRYQGNNLQSSTDINNESSWTNVTSTITEVHATYILYSDVIISLTCLFNISGTPNIELRGDNYTITVKNVNGFEGIVKGDTWNISDIGVINDNSTLADGAG